MAIVYQHRKKDSGDIFYIGIGVNKNRAYKKYGRNLHWKNIVDKHGYEVDILVEGCSFSEAIEIEVGLIQSYGRKDLGLGQLVNMTEGGEGTIGHIRSAFLKDQHSKKMKGLLIGQKNPMYNKKNAILSELNKKRTGENNPKAKKVVQYDINGNFIAEYKTAKIAEEITGIIRSGICQACKGLNKTSGGFIWKYKNKEHESNS